MWPVMVGNIFINAAWVSAFCYMIYLNKNIWAGICILAALLSTYSYKKGHNP